MNRVQCYFISDEIRKLILPAQFLNLAKTNPTPCYLNFLNKIIESTSERLPVGVQCLFMNINHSYVWGREEILREKQLDKQMCDHTKKHYFSQS